MSLRIRLVLSLAGVLAVTLALGCVLAIWHATRSVRTEMQAALEVGQQTVTNGLDEMASSAEPQRDLHQLVRIFDGNRHVLTTATDAQGRIVAVSALPVRLRQVPRWFTDAISPTLPAVRIELPPHLGDGASITLTADPTNEAGEVWDAAGDGLDILAIFFGLTVMLIYLMMGRALGPLTRLSSAFGRLGAGDYAARLPVEGPPELAVLAQGFNRMAEQLGAAEARNRRLHEQLLKLQEEERAELARDLHDDIGPFLFAVSVDTASIPRLLEAGRAAEVNDRLIAIRDAVDHMQSCIRSVLGRLRPYRLAEVDLQAAIGNLVAFWRSRHPGISFAVRVADEADAIADPLRATVCRIVQESISNAVRHGNPRRIEIDISRETDELLVRIADDGTGFGGNRGTPHGFGLVGMRERVSAQAGSLVIADRPDGGGLAVTARLPCDGHVATRIEAAAA